MVPSKLNRLDWPEAHIKRALRFIHTIPEHEWYGVHAFPDYVFDYVYNGTLLIDAPWIQLIEDDFGQRVMKNYRGTPLEQASMIEESPLFSNEIHKTYLFYWIRALRAGDITIIDIESNYFYSKKRTYWTNGKN